MKRANFARTGLTLVETMVIIGISSMVLAALTTMIVSFYRTNQYVIDRASAVENARRSIATAEVDLREASYGADGSYPIASAATSTVTFFANTDKDSSVEKVRYYLQNTTLYRGTTQPAGSSYAGQPEIIDLVIDNIRNGTSTPLFSYYDSSGSPLTAPVNVSKIVIITLQVLADVNPNRAPYVYYMSDTVKLRNITASAGP